MGKERTYYNRLQVNLDLTITYDQKEVIMKTQTMQARRNSVVSPEIMEVPNFKFRRMTMKSSRYCLLVLTLLFLAMVPAVAANITTVYNTGVDDNHAPLNSGSPNGATDPHYKIVSGPALLYGPKFTGGLAYTTPPDTSWWKTAANAEWINPIDSGTGGPSSATPGGDYDYQTSFDVCCIDPETVVIVGKFAADNSACIWVNGVQTKWCTPVGNGFTTPTSFQLDSTNSTFVAGVNKIDFVVHNRNASWGDTTSSGLVVSISSATGQ